MLLSQEQAEQMLGYVGNCFVCIQPVEKVYCRDHDDFLEIGHRIACSNINKDHLTCRYQRRGDDIRELLLGLK